MAFGTLSQYSGLFKDVFADKLSDVVPSFALLQDDIPFRNSKRVGELFSQPILVQRSHSATYLASADGTVTLNPVLASKTVEAQITGSQIVFRDAIDYEAAFASEGDQAAFTPAMKLTVEALWEGSHHRIEADLLYGQDTNGLGTVNGVPAADVVIFDVAQFAEGLWTGMEGAELEIFSSDLATKRDGVGRDTVTTAAPGFYTITAVDLDNNTITVDDDQNIADNDVIFFRTQRTTSAFKTMAGLHTWLTNTGTIANVSASSFNLWKPVTIDALNGAFSFDLVLQGCARVSMRGAMGTMCCYCHPLAWANAMQDLAATVRRNHKDVKEYILGAESICFYTGTGKVFIKAHPMVKPGFAYTIPLSTGEGGGENGAYQRIGATDLTFVTQQGRGSRTSGTSYFEKLPNTNAVEVQTYSHQALYSNKPARGFVIINIVNTLP